MHHVFRSVFIGELGIPPGIEDAGGGDVTDFVAAVVQCGIIEEIIEKVPAHLHFASDTEHDLCHIVGEITGGDTKIVGSYDGVDVFEEDVWVFEVEL